MQRVASSRLRLGLTVVVVVLALNACTGDEAPEAPTKTTAQDSAAPVDELAAHEGQPCPEALVDPGDEYGFGTEKPAARAPNLAVQDQGWMCVYQALDKRRKRNDGTRYTWRITEEATALDEDALARVQTAIATVEPAAMEGRICTSDLGSRVLIVTAREGDLTGFVVDEYGCSDIRMTDDPFTSTPGVATQPGTVSGVLDSAELARIVRDHAELPR